MKQITLFMIGFLLFNIVNGQQLNKVGFLPKSVKRVFLNEEFQNQPFSILNEAGAVVFESKTTTAKSFEFNKIMTCFADFTELKQEGTFAFQLSGIESLSVDIKNDTYEKLAYDFGRYFYHVRASVPILEKYAEDGFARPASHLDKKIYVHNSAKTYNKPVGAIVESPGGWLNSGDYNKYIVNSSMATYMLLHTINMYDDHVAKIDFNTPESEDGVPDLVQDAVHNIRWMLTMQDNDGGVFHKLTSKAYSREKNPFSDKRSRYLMNKSTAATLNFVAVMAKASGVLANYGHKYAKLSNKALIAANKALKWAIRNPKFTYKQPKDIQTKVYGDEDLNDEWLWADTEMYLATRNESHLDRMDYKGVNFDTPNWQNVALLSVLSVIVEDQVDEKLEKKMTKIFMKLIDKYYENYENSAYKISLSQYPVKNSELLVSQGVLFLHAYKITDEIKYVKAADACLSFLLGANPDGHTYISGYGINELKEDQSNGGGEFFQDCYNYLYPYILYNSINIDNVCANPNQTNALNRMSLLTFLVLGLDTHLKN